MLQSRGGSRQRDGGRHTLPVILGDETIYSWCATAHNMSCSMSAAETGVRLLGATHAVKQHDLPAGLALLPLVHTQDAAAIVECLRSHTIAGYYLPFQSQADQLRVGSNIHAAKGVHWRRMCSGVSRTRPINHPLKWCGLCAQNDTATVGRPYWHTDLQFPTTWLCPTHEAPLSFLPERSKRWRLPSSADIQPMPLGASDVQAAAILTAISESLLHIKSIDIAALRAATILRLQEIGIIHTDGGVRHERIQKWFTSTGVASLCRYQQTGLDRFCEGDWISELLWGKKLSHATRWAILWASLGWDRPAESASAFRHAALGGHPTDGQQLLLFNSNMAGGRSAPSSVRAAFESSDSYGDVMLRLQVSRSDVVRWLERDPVLRAEWRGRLKQGKQRQCIDRIKGVALGAPNLTRQQLESACSAEVRWLREHAPSLLHGMLKSVPGRSSAQRSLFQLPSTRSPQCPSTSDRHGGRRRDHCSSVERRGDEHEAQQLPSHAPVL